MLILYRAVSNSVITISGIILLRFISVLIINIHMTINTTGPITLSSVNLEIGAATTASISLGGVNARTLAGIAAPGPISMSNLRGRNLRGAEYFTATTVYTVSTGVTFLRWIVVAAGGAAGPVSGSGGGGGGQVVTTSSFSVQGGDTVNIVVGVGTSTRGGNSSVTNTRTGLTVTARGGYAGYAPVGSLGGAGGISFSPESSTQYGGAGAAGPAGGGGAGPGALGTSAVEDTPGLGAAPLLVQINTTQSVYLSPGGAGVGTTATSHLSGAGSSELGLVGVKGVVILY